MLIGGDDFSNDVITLSTCFLIFVCLELSFSLLADWSTEEAQGGGIQIPETRSCKLSILPFLAPPPERLESLLAGYNAKSSARMSTP